MQKSAVSCSNNLKWQISVWFSYHLSPPVLGFWRSHKQPTPCPIHGHFTQALACIKGCKTFTQSRDYYPCISAVNHSGYVLLELLSEFLKKCWGTLIWAFAFEFVGHPRYMIFPRYPAVRVGRCLTGCLCSVGLTFERWGDMPEWSSLAAAPL